MTLAISCNFLMQIAYNYTKKEICLKVFKSANVNKFFNI